MSTYLPRGYNILQLKWWQREIAVLCGLVLIGHAPTLYFSSSYTLKVKLLCFISVLIINVLIIYDGILMRPLR